TSGLLFFLAGDADARPRDRVEPCIRNRLAAVAADAIGALVDAPERVFDRLQDLRVGLFQFELDVDLVGAARLVRHVALPPRVVLHRPLQRLGGRASEQLAAFLQQLRAVLFDFHGGRTPAGQTQILTHYAQGRTSWERTLRSASTRLGAW